MVVMVVIILMILQNLTKSQEKHVSHMGLYLSVGLLYQNYIKF